MKSLSGKVAVVTGAGRGIGRSIAKCLAAAGAKVVINYAHSQGGAEELVKELQDEGLTGLAIKADVSVVEEIERMVQLTVEAYGRIDILINNAAIDPTEDFFQVTEAFWEKVVNTNLKGTFFCAQACAREMQKTGSGKIINISSVHGELTMPRYAVYASTKGGINALTRQLALDLAKYHITVNAVAPGATEVEKFIGQAWYDPEEMGSYIPLGRIGQPADIAPMIHFLASEDANFITGQIITIDGGSSTKLFLPVDVT
ncbi:SDR family NAD(P)-dependent oxidoreductase [Paenibacillus eucommiae]|uniref:Glucose 1-dehydrogenase/3-oxoacyl-[acyl-carrier protein] reductase n=1 Tax=Paenibacillus eucommiae TaxID=1355755 RepID=A0ABS4J453_9BACL|nr:3-oxoacyl-ACP reductase family protein [Paenibacillus eucommiae]MBP1994006.1 glucose 1-dehydrogenase/3-oxoacyl-[acyl-carrier protein] reductase [Paenibacillus eucommiae]